MPNFFSIIWEILKYPVRAWQGGCSDGSSAVETKWGYTDCSGGGYYEDPDKLFAVMIGIFVYGIPLLIIVLIATWLYGIIDWRRTRNECQHCGGWTREVSDGSWSGCLVDKGCCSDCVEIHLDDEVVQRAQQEPLVTCPGCSTTMEKQIQNRIILDVCPACGAIYLSTKHEMVELEKLAEKAGYRKGYDDGRSSGSSSGMIIGMAVGSAIN